MVVLIVLFGFFIIYQIIKIMLGGSWTNQETMLVSLMFQLGAIFTMAVNLATLKSDHKHLTKEVTRLTKDFYKVKEEIHKLTLNMHRLVNGFKNHIKQHR